MIRAGVVTHPSVWRFSGYSEIQNPTQRYPLIDNKRLMNLLNIQAAEDLKKLHSRWIENAIMNQKHARESRWVQSVAVGSGEFVELTKMRLGFQVKGRRVHRSDEGYSPRHVPVYNDYFEPISHKDSSYEAYQYILPQILPPINPAPLSLSIIFIASLPLNSLFLTND
jgi:hypothetical protein